MIQTKQTLKQRIQIGTAAAGISLAVLCGGCMTEEEARWGRVLGVAAQVSPNTDYNMKAAGAVIDTASKDSLDTVNAEKSRSQVNVNVGGNAGQGNSIINEVQKPDEYLAIIEDLETNEIITDKAIPYQNREGVDSYIVRRGNYFGRAYEVRIYRNSYFYKKYRTVFADKPNRGVINATGISVPKQ